MPITNNQYDIKARLNLNPPAQPAKISNTNSLPNDASTPFDQQSLKPNNTPIPATAEQSITQPIQEPEISRQDKFNQQFDKLRKRFATLSPEHQEREIMNRVKTHEDFREFREATHHDQTKYLNTIKNVMNPNVSKGTKNYVRNIVY